MFFLRINCLWAEEAHSVPGNPETALLAKFGSDGRGASPVAVSFVVATLVELPTATEDIFKVDFEGFDTLSSGVNGEENVREKSARPRFDLVARSLGGGRVGNGVRPDVEGSPTALDKLGNPG